VLAPGFGSCLRAGHADQREPFRQSPWCACKVVERRHHRVLGQFFTRHAAGACPRVGSFP
jgi:hypothetical protein